MIDCTSKSTKCQDNSVVVELTLPSQNNSWYLRVSKSSFAWSTIAKLERTKSHPQAPAVASSEQIVPAVSFAIREAQKLTKKPFK